MFGPRSMSYCHGLNRSGHSSLPPMVFKELSAELDKTEVSLLTEELKQEKRKSQDYKVGADRQRRYAVCLETTNSDSQLELEAMRWEEENLKAALAESETQERK